LGNGIDLGIRFEYVVQPSLNSLVQMFILGEEFLCEDDACLVLGDNFFYGHSLSKMLTNAVQNDLQKSKVTVFNYHVTDLERYGMTEFDESGNVISLDEKPTKPKSNYAVTGLYSDGFKKNVFQFANE